MQEGKIKIAILAGAAGMAAAILLAGAIVVTPRQASATPAFAQKTGQPCTKCHTAPPVLNDYGKKYKEGMKR
jgi:hypothetical protein